MPTRPSDINKIEYFALSQRDTRVIPKVSGLDILDNNIFYHLYISETYIFYEL